MLTAIEFKSGTFYTERGLRLAGIDGDVLRRARESGRLKYRPEGGEIYYLGEWINEWLGKPEGTAGKAVPR